MLGCCVPAGRAWLASYSDRLSHFCPQKARHHSLQKIQSIFAAGKAGWVAALAGKSVSSVGLDFIQALFPEPPVVVPGCAVTAARHALLLLNLWPQPAGCGGHEPGCDPQRLHEGGGEHPKAPRGQ